MKFLSSELEIATSAASIVDFPMESELKVLMWGFLSPKFRVVMRR
jgi:hypothetical protein